MAARTTFFDAQTQASIAGGVRQVVILAAGYDGRALRFAHPDVRFFEVDLPGTQADKRCRLEDARADVTNVAFVPADLTTDDLPPLLAAAGFIAGAPALFTCEGLLTYLTRAHVEQLLRSVHAAAAPSSVFACNFHVRPPDAGLRARAGRAAVDLLLRAIGEPRRSVFAPGDPEALLSSSGWVIDTRIEADHEPDHGYGVCVSCTRR